MQQHGTKAGKHTLRGSRMSFKSRLLKTWGLILGTDMLPMCCGGFLSQTADEQGLGNMLGQSMFLLIKHSQFRSMQLPWSTVSLSNAVA